MKTSTSLYSYLLLCSCNQVAAFMSQGSAPLAFNTVNNKTPSLSVLDMAGFGGGGGGMSKKQGGKKKNQKANTASKLKPKAQWDRYMKMKKLTGVRVSARVNNGDDKLGEWMEIGKIKSENDELAEAAVALQRAIIAEHAKRMLPHKFLPKDRVEWAYSREDLPSQEDWIIIDKNTVNETPSGFDKTIGFEGKADPGTGFYCHYKDGRLVDRYDEGKTVAKKGYM